MKTKWDALSIRGRVAYAIMACERYLFRFYPDRDMTPVARYMWDIVNDVDYIDDSAYKYMDIIPDYLFEAGTYEDSEMVDMTREEYEVFIETLPRPEEDPGLNSIMHRIYDVAMLYAYTVVKLDDPETKEYLREVDEILVRNGVDLPDVSSIPQYVPDETDGWGDFIDSKGLSITLKD